MSLTFLEKEEKTQLFIVRSKFFVFVIVIVAIETALARSATKYQLNFIHWQHCSFIEHLILVRCSFLSCSLNSDFVVCIARIHASVSTRRFIWFIHHIYGLIHMCVCVYVSVGLFLSRALCQAHLSKLLVLLFILFLHSSSHLLHVLVFKALTLTLTLERKLKQNENTIIYYTQTNCEYK